MSTRFAIEIEVQMCGHKFIIKALAVDTLGGIGLVVGNDALEDIDASLDFRRHQLRFKSNSIVLKPVHTMILKPFQTRTITITGRLPHFLRNAQAMIQATNYISQFTCCKMLVQFENGVAVVVVTNPTNNNVKIRNDKAFATLNVNALTNMYLCMAGVNQSDDNTTLHYFVASEVSDPQKIATPGQKINQQKVSLGSDIFHQK
jgi:hypothetical protein